MAKSYLDRDFNDHADLDDCLLAVSKAYSKTIARAVSQTEESDKHREIVRSLLGISNPPSHAAATNMSLVNCAVARTAAALEQVVGEERAVSRQFLFCPDPTEPRSYAEASLDLKGRAVPLLRELKATAANGIAVIQPLAKPEGLELSTSAFVWSKSASAAAPGNHRQRKPRVEGLKDGMVIDGDPLSLAKTAAQLWTPIATKLKLECGKKGWKAERPSNEHAELELRGFMVRSLLRLDNIAFGFGEGKLVLRTVLKQVTARAASLNLGHTAPIHEAGIPRFLSQLCSELDDSLNLPVVQPLKK